MELTCGLTVTNIILHDTGQKKFHEKSRELNALIHALMLKQAISIKVAGQRKYCIETDPELEILVGKLDDVR